MSKKKALFTATVVKHHIAEFHLPYMQYLQNRGVETHVCAKNDYIDEECVIPYCNEFHEVNFSRSPFSLKNLSAYRKLKKIINEGNYDLIHCNTPVAGILTRFAARKARKNGTKVIYTAHGFHFFKGAPKHYWLLFFTAEWICSWMTDVLITINDEDYQIAKNKMHAFKTVYCPSVGIDVKKFTEERSDREAVRASLGIKTEEIMLLTVGELIKRKNHEILIRALKKIDRADIHLFIAGEGELKEYTQNLIKELDLEKNVHMLGYCNDVKHLYYAADIFCFSSWQEGLGMAALEAMACGLPTIVSDVRGINEYSENGVTGFSCEPDNLDKYAEYIEKLASDSILRTEIGRNNIAKVNKFDIANTLKIVGNIYDEVISE